ncbi:MAG: hypothetical protein HN576_05335 [Bacteriovoracaceae bacterium]|jgi:hypothetical protein|nr:hypothetical protein [Bacteriovoracaceae bacterium]
MTKRNLIKILLPLCLIACNQKEYTKDICNQLSFRGFKGSPAALNELNKNCKNINYKYTKDYCQKILTRFILTGNQKLIIAEFGLMAPSCLTESDLNRFITK